MPARSEHSSQEPFWASRCACFNLPPPRWSTAAKINQRLLGSAAAGCFHRSREDPALRGQLLPHQPLSSSASGSVVRDNTEAVPAKHESICDACRTSYSWDREGGDFFVRTQWELSSCSNPLDPQWLLLLDPRTWGAAEDSETRGLLWCPVKGCATGSRWKEFVFIAKTWVL
jgi:hypothetical protein